MASRKTSKRPSAKAPARKAAGKRPGARPAPRRAAAKAKKQSPASASKRPAAAQAKAPPRSLGARAALAGTPAAVKRVAAGLEQVAARLQPAGSAGPGLEATRVEDVLARLPPPVKPLVALLRRVLLEAAPGAIELLERDNPTYDAHGVFARLEPGLEEVAVRFFRGKDLAAAAGLPREGSHRLLRVASLTELDQALLQGLVREAVALNLSLVKR